MGENQVRVAIMGAGLGGLAMAVALKTQLGFDNFIIYEQASDLGGTWRDNTYPGCACDVPVHWYSLSTELNPDWTCHFAEQPEILSYWHRVAAKHDLRKHIVFDTRVATQAWDDDERVWKLHLVKRKTPEAGIEIVKAEVLVSAVGGLVTPGFSNLSGHASFRGPQFHSARWDHNVDLKGKRVGVIGNGCSAAQFIPRISEDPSTQVINFSRTPSWFAPKTQFHYPAIARWMFRWIPGCGRLYRNILMFFSDLRIVIWFKRTSFLRRFVEKEFLAYMRAKAPRKYHDQLTPKYALGCKRIIVDPGYYACMHRPNVEMKFGAVREIVPDGVVTFDGVKHDLDVIIYGTGFLLVDPDINTIGRGGKHLIELWASRGGPEAYRGTTYPGFPNFFTILGPNVAAGHASAIFSEEQQINYIVQLIRPIIEHKAHSFEVTDEANRKFNAKLQKTMQKTTWVTCSSYYRVGEGHTGKVIATYPGPAIQLWWEMRKVDWKDYVGVGSERWEKELASASLLRKMLMLLMMVATAVGLQAGQEPLRRRLHRP